MDQKTYHIGLWRYAREFFWAADILREHEETTINVPAYFLYCHSIELAMKALLVHSGSDEKELRKIGHNLMVAWEKAINKGLNKHLANVEEIKNAIELINPYYQAKELEYIVTGLKSFPSILYMSKVTARLIHSVGKAINIPDAQLNKRMQPIADKAGSG